MRGEKILLYSELNILLAFSVEREFVVLTKINKIFTK